MATTRQTHIIDKLGEDVEDTLPETYSISSYGADYPVDVLVKRMQSGDIYTPDFQRAYVWNLKQASRFIESLLLGLPVPAIFLSRERETEKFLVIDGQQRLKTLQHFYEGKFPSARSEHYRDFALVGVQERFKGLRYQVLPPELRRKLDNSTIHAIVFQQDDPKEGNTSIYHVFERLNTGGTKLLPQEIRASVFHGPLQDLLRKLNENKQWRGIFGPINRNLRDQELVLRFLALYFEPERYEEPMKQFLNEFMDRNRNLKRPTEADVRKAFEPTIELVSSSLGKKPFRPQRAFNAAVFDSVMIGLARRLKKGQIHDLDTVRKKYDGLLKDRSFLEATERATADPERVKLRLELATNAFSDLK